VLLASKAFKSLSRLTLPARRDFMSKVFVLDTKKRPLDPIHSAQARQLLRNKKAAIFRQFPFTIILKKSRPDSPVSSLRLHIDPGAKFTQRMVIRMQYKRFVNYSTVPLVVCAGAQNYSTDVSQLTLHSSHRQTEYSFGGGLLEV
jgi:hypothetical protein